MKRQCSQCIDIYVKDSEALWGGISRKNDFAILLIPKTISILGSLS